MFAQAGVGAGERGEHGFGGERAEAVEHAEGVVLREGIGEGAQERDGGGVLAFVEEAGGGVAVPAVGVGEGGDEFGGGGGAERDAGAALPRGVVRHEAVEAAAGVAAIEVEVLLDLFGDAPRVLDDFAIHVADVEGAVGGVGEIHDAHPSIGAGGEFVALLVGGATADETGAVGVDFFPVHELAAGVAREGVVHELVAVGIAAKDGGAGGAGEVAAHAAAALDHAFDHAADAPARADDAPRFVGTEAEDLGGPAVGGDALAGGRRREERVPGGVAFVVDPELEVIGVGAGEFAAVVVEAHAVLRAAGFKTEGVGAWIKPEVAGAKFFGGQIGALRTVNQPAVAEAAHEVDAVVLAPSETAEHGLDVEGF